MGRSVRMRSPVNWAVLGLVIERSSYGYELFNRLQRRYDGVLNPVIGHIYTALDSLEKAKLIEPIDHERRTDEIAVRRTQREQRISYRATAFGEGEFREWVAEQLYGDPQHIELLRRIAATPGAGFGEVGLMRELVAGYEQVCVEEASRMPLSSPGAAPGAPARSVAELAERLVREARRELLDGHYRWIDYARREIDAFSRASIEGADEPAGA